jgi:hypothetical protein
MTRIRRRWRISRECRAAKRSCSGRCSWQAAVSPDLVEGPGREWARRHDRRVLGSCHRSPGPRSRPAPARPGPRGRPTAVSQPRVRRGEPCDRRRCGRVRSAVARREPVPAAVLALVENDHHLGAADGADRIDRWRKAQRPPAGWLAAADFLMIAAGPAPMGTPRARHVDGYLAVILPEWIAADRFRLRFRSLPSGDHRLPVIIGLAAVDLPAELGATGSEVVTVGRQLAGVLATAVLVVIPGGATTTGAPQRCPLAWWVALDSCGACSPVFWI